MRSGARATARRRLHVARGHARRGTGHGGQLLSLFPSRENMIPRNKATSASMEVLTWLENARNRATAERRNFEVTFDATQRRSRSSASRRTARRRPSWCASCRITSKFLQVQRRARHARPVRGGRRSTSTARRLTCSPATASFIDANGDPSNGTIFMGKTGQLDTGPRDHGLRRDRPAAFLEARWNEVDQMSTDPDRRRRATSEEGFSAHRGPDRDPRPHRRRAVAPRRDGAWRSDRRRVVADADRARKGARGRRERAQRPRHRRARVEPRAERRQRRRVPRRRAGRSRLPGLDGLVNTADDGAIEELRHPGADGILNNADDIVMPLDPTNCSSARSRLRRSHRRQRRPSIRTCGRSRSTSVTASSAPGAPTR